MSRFLRHPVRAIREPFGTAGLIVACVALVLALTGAAFAAGKLTSKEKKEVEKIAKKFAGKAGAPGAPGANGTNGASGAPGAAGKSIAVSKIEPGEEACEERGGVEVKTEGSGSAREVCNGKAGADGTNGTFSTEPLPSGQTLTGVWSTATQGPVGETHVEPQEEEIEYAVETEPGVFENKKKTVVTSVSAPITNSSGNTTVSISLPIEVKPAPQAVLEAQPGFPGGYGLEKEAFSFVFQTWSEDCPGSAEEPKAAPGFLCLYVSEGVATPEPSSRIEAAHSFGVNIPLHISEAGSRRVSGSWAVTAS